MISLAEPAFNIETGTSGARPSLKTCRWLPSPQTPQMAGGILNPGLPVPPTAALLLLAFTSRSIKQVQLG